MDGKKINYDIIDVAVDVDAKNKMREGSGNQQALPPQIFNDDIFCGDYDAFEEAVENESLNEFLKLDLGS